MKRNAPIVLGLCLAFSATSACSSAPTPEAVCKKAQKLGGKASSVGFDKCVAHMKAEQKAEPEAFACRGKCMLGASSRVETATCVAKKCEGKAKGGKAKPSASEMAAWKDKRRKKAKRNLHYCIKNCQAGSASNRPQCLKACATRMTQDMNAI